ncbi:MAG: hypothetical protein NC226_03850, partial [Bacteroides cellulosilyticus]|nr:hypothetical protein [Bacteroides cellulosilyticus]
RASASQAEGREFEPRFPLNFEMVSAFCQNTKKQAAVPGKPIRLLLFSLGIRYDYSDSEFRSERNEFPIAHIQSNLSTIHSQAFFAMRTTRKTLLTRPERTAIGFRMNTK